MRLHKQALATTSLAGLALCVAFGLVYSSPVTAQPPAAGARGGAKGGAKGGGAPDPRVQMRMYHFEDTNEDLPYALFVSSKVTKGKAAPLIVALHGYSAPPQSMLPAPALDLAEAGGYILVAPMGYNRTGWYGSPVVNAGAAPAAGKGGAKGAPAAKGDAKGGAPPPGAKGGAPGAKGGAPAAKGGAKGGRGGGLPPPDPAPDNLAEVSEKDVMNVLTMVRKEFNVDPKRTYLMGHSMGGAGTFFLGVKHASEWAAIAAMAPAAMAMQPTMLEPIKNTVPLLIVHGDADTLVNVSLSRNWDQTIKGFPMKNYKYLELPGEDHISVVNAGLADVFKFFAEHTKP